MAWLRRHVGLGFTTWHLQWREAGKVRSRSLGPVTKAEAEKSLAEWESGARQIEAPSSCHTDLAARFLKDVGLSRSPETVRFYRERLSLLLPALGRLDRATPAAFRRFLEDRTPLDKRHHGVVARRFIAWARAARLPVADFAAGISFPTVHRADPDYLTAADLAALLDAARGTPLEVAVALGALAGMRRAEILRAHSRDVRWTETPPILVVHGTKGHRDRRVPISAALAEVLRRRRVVGPLARWGGWASSIYKPLRRLCDEAGIRRIGMHALRHTFATRMVASGIDLPTIARLLGHTSASTTTRYLHTDTSRLAAAVETVVTQ